MNPVFLEKYHHELRSFRDASKEFAKEHPSIAGHLGLLAPEIEDPYVERLIEAVSFLTARINLKIEEQYPQFLTHIFKVIQPSFTRIIPSSVVVAVSSGEKKPIAIPKGTVITTHAKKQGGSVCQFSTCHDAQIIPLAINSTIYNRVARNHSGHELYRANLNIKLSLPSALELDSIDFEGLHFYIQETDYYTATELLYHLSQKSKPLTVKSDDFKSTYPTAVKLCGFDMDLDIYGDRKIDYLKNVTEYSVLPEKYLFFQLSSIQSILKDCLNFHKKSGAKSNVIELDITIPFEDISSNLEKYLQKSFLSLNSLLITNAFLKKTRFVVDANTNEQHIVMDKVRAKDFEIIGIKSVEGFNATNAKVKSFEPVYKVDSHHAINNAQDIGFFTDNYEPSYYASATNSYKGNECHLLINNQYQHIKYDDLNQLSIEAWCSNRALVREISWTLDEDLVLDDRFKIDKITRQCRFTEPLDSPIHTVELWRLMNLISANFVVGELEDKQALTNQIKNSLFAIYEISKNEAFKSQIDAITLVQANLVSQNYKQNHKLTPINGVHFDVILDEALMSHAHPYIWGRVLLSYLKGFSPINKFTKLTLRNKKNEVITDFNTLDK